MAPVRNDEGQGVIEVIVALTVLSLTLLAVGWLLISAFSVSNLAKQRATAGSLIEQVDALFQTNVPALTCANAATYVSGAGTGTATRNGTEGVAGDNNSSSITYTVTSSSSTPSGGLLPITISVSWKPAQGGQATQSISNQLKVQCQ